MIKVAPRIDRPEYEYISVSGQGHVSEPRQHTAVERISLTSRNTTLIPVYVAQPQSMAEE